MRLVAFVWAALVGGTALGAVTNFLGVDSDVLRNRFGLTGEGVQIGQVEIGRPGKPEYDTGNGTTPPRFHSQVIPTQVYAGTVMDAPNSAYVNSINGNHATQVAGVMIGKHTPVAIGGVAPDAQLHAAAILATGDEYGNYGAALNRIATVNRGAAVATNMSFGVAIDNFIDVTDGNSQYTRFIDWSAEEHDVLYVVAGNQDTEYGPAPSDNFNGVTVGASIPQDSYYRTVADFNDYEYDAVGSRTSVDLIAPGDQFAVHNFNNGFDLEEFGTSLAAPYVTGTVALLHEHANNEAWGDDAREAEVMKAVLLNSADKLNGVLGSRRAVLDSNGSSWLTSPGYLNPFDSLDPEFGAGHLNSAKAWWQYQTGEHEGLFVPNTGWSFRNTGGEGTSDEYIISSAFGGWVAITLTWNINVELANVTGEWQFGDVFFEYDDIQNALNDLNLYLMEADEPDQANAIQISNTLVDNVEHIYAQVPPGEYKIRVTHDDSGPGDPQDYALAWWTTPARTPGDFDSDGDVDGDDRTQWKGDFGALNFRSDADNDGDSDGADFLAWQRNLGATSAAPNNGSRS